MLPSDVDGQQIEWRAEGGIGINESNQVIVEADASISGHDAPEVGSALESTSALSELSGSGAVLDDASTEISAEPQPEQSASDDTPSDPAIGGMKLKASINGITKNYALAVAAPKSTGYTTWDEVGQAMAGSGIPGYEVPILVDGYYEIWNGTQLAWFAAKVNQGNTAWNARLMSDIDLFGREHNGYTGEPVMANISNAMRLTGYISMEVEISGCLEG